MSNSRLRIGIVGVGAIGGYVGLRLASAGVQVFAIGRGAMLEKRDQLQWVDLEGKESAAAPSFSLSDQRSALRGCDLVCIAVKSRDTLSAATSIIPHIRPGTPVLSLQNGLANCGRLRDTGLHGVQGVVTFNVRLENHVFRQSTSGPIYAGDDPSLPPGLDAAFAGAGLEFERRADIEEVARGKLILNLNNGVCAVAGVGIVESIKSQDLRCVYAACINEALAVFKARKEPVARLGRLAPRLIGALLPWPDFIVHRLTKPMIRLDPKARSSTLVDLDMGKTTEIDDLNGAIADLADQFGLKAPVNAWIRQEVRRLEAPNAGPRLSAPQMRAKAEELLARS